MTIIQSAVHDNSGDLAENQEPPPSGRLIQDAETFFCLKRWSQNTLTINKKGHLTLNIDEHSLDLYQLAQALASEKQWPVLLRFPALITKNISAIQNAFANAIKKMDYKNDYTLAYPLKVNPHASVVKTMMESEHAEHMSFEVGSKAELIIALTATTKNQRIMCNGFKDAGYISLVLEAAKVGQKVCLVFETLDEVEHLIAMLEQQKKSKNSSGKDSLLPEDLFLGLRLRLSTPVEGHWEDSNGKYSKFGLSSIEALQVIGTLEKYDLLSHLRAMHIHPGSQILAIKELSGCFQEAVRFYHELLKLNAPIEYVDIGGGLAMDYSGAAEEKLRDYTLDDYATAIVQPMKKYCQENNLPEPHIISETGRNTVALSSMLLTDIKPLGELNENHVKPVDKLKNNHSFFIQQLWELHLFIEGFHNIEKNEKQIEAAHAQHEFLLNNIREEFLDNKLTLSDLAWAEKMVAHNQSLLHAGLTHAVDVMGVHSEKSIHQSCALQKNYQKYIANFSVFQSMPDYWGIQQFFPMLSLHGYEKELTRSGVFYDLTCDSDGVVKHYLHPEKLQSTLKMPDCDVEFMGIFLMGAYQEIMASGHNLFEKLPCLDVTWNAKTQQFETHLYEACDIGDSLSAIGYDELNLVELSRKKFSAPMHALIQANLEKNSYLEYAN